MEINLKHFSKNLQETRSLEKPGFSVTLMLLNLPWDLNMMTGFSNMGNWYDGVMDAVERDIDAGMSISEIAQRNGKSLVHWFTQEQLENHIQMLYEDRVGPFAKIKQKPTTP